jgi:phage shock protein PspC (stress-responsive transcriptional regulator)
MKKTFTINIRGSVFHIDEDAYEVLQKYMLDIKNHFDKNNDGQEIISDIEFRLAELFTEKEQTVITIDKVIRVIEVMGQPEVFDEEKEVKPKIKKRLYRDTEHKVICGVCGGLAAYFNTDPAIMRLITILLFLISAGTVLLGYIILWIAVPKAVNTTQKMEMMGESVTVKNIERFIKETMDKYKK